MHVAATIVHLIASPANLYCLMLLLGGFFAVSHDESRQRFGRRLCFTLALLLFFVGIFPVGHWLLGPLENRFPASQATGIDGIILLAGDEDPFLTEARDQAALGAAAPRYITFAALAREHPKARLAFIGGNNALTRKTKLTNEDVARLAVDSLGISQSRMSYESRSRNTYENAIFGAKKIQPKPDQKWLLVTSASHLPRALMTFRKAGWNVLPAPADYRTAKASAVFADFNVSRHLVEMNIAFREYAGLLAYWALGRIDIPWKF